jgi:pimeloyl-ACP methyl ester carboxylesterase
MIKWLRRISVGIVALVVLAVGGGATYEALARADAARRFPPPGRLVDIGGRRIQLDCRGAGSPVVVFESGLDSLGSLSWAAVHDGVAGFTRACAYSRAGLMWSDPAGRPFASLAAADDLHRALAAAGEKGPYVLVAHSLGGPYAMVFTGRYGADVAGLVFVDASHPDQVGRLNAALSKPLDQGEGQLRLGDALAWSGLVRLITAQNPVGPPSAPAGIVAPARDYLPSSLHAMRAESDAIAAALATAGRTRSLGDRPLVVLTHSVTPAATLRAAKLSPADAARLDAVWLELQNDEASWSTKSRHTVVPGATHYIQFDQPQVVVGAVREVVGEVRAAQAHP